MDQRKYLGSPPSAAVATAHEPQPTGDVSLHGSAAESPSRRRNHDESWVEIASQPSSSSLSSIGGDEIVTTGLRVHGSSYPPRRRQAPVRQALQHRNTMPQSYIVSHAAARGGTSSQEDFDETESEDDPLPVARRPAGLEAPSAHLHTASRQETPARHESSGYDDDDDDSGDENATALGLPSAAPHVFRPQPNAFSHPPSHLTHRHSTPGAYIGGSISGPHARATGPRSRRSSYSRGGSSRNAPQFMSPAYREDNDAALRASLTTLLSCAAAARGLPSRRGDGSDALGAGPASNAAAMQPMDLRIVPEAELMAEKPAPPPSQSSGGAGPEAKGSKAAAAVQPAAAAAAAKKKTTPGIFAPSSSPASSTARGEKSKRAAAGSPPSVGQKTSGRATKKKRVDASASVPETLISPTLLTWVVSAGVVVLVSVVGFGAGYVIGREVGRQEGAGGFIASGVPPGPSANATGSCGRDVISQSTTGGTLRRFRWSSMGRSVMA